MTGPTMGTRYHIKYVTSGQSGTPAPAALQLGVDAVLAAIDLQMSNYRPDSELSQFNSNPSTDWFPVSADIVTVVNEALRISELSHGAFDVTVAPLVDLWGFGPVERRRSIPSDRELRVALDSIGYRHIGVRRDPPAIRKDIPDLQLDLGAIAPGFAVDKLAAYLESQGIESYLIELGGEVYGKGRKADGERWKVGLERPAGSTITVDALLEIDGRGLSSSGAYRNFFELNGRQYSHEIDPRTGWPAAGDIVAVSVVATTTMTADALSTALLVLGEKEAIRLATVNRLAMRLVVRTPDGMKAVSTPAFDGLTVR